MRTEQDAMMLVRADLCERLDALRRMSVKLRAADRAEAAAGIGALAAAYGLTPVVRLAEALGRSIRDAGPCQSDLYIERLEDAIGCRRLDDEASQAIMASVSVRFSQVDALLTTFIAALLGEFGDKTQLLVIALAARYRAPGAILGGVAVAALANNLIAAAGGVLVSGMITLRAISLLVALALLFAGIAGLMRSKSPAEMGSTWKTGAFVTTAACFFLLEFGDKTQFLTFALAAQYDALALAAAGATAGVVAANLPAAVLGEKAASVLHLNRVRIGIAALFLAAGLAIALSALRLV